MRFKLLHRATMWVYLIKGKRKCNIFRALQIAKGIKNELARADDLNQDGSQLARNTQEK